MVTRHLVVSPLPTLRPTQTGPPVETNAGGKLPGDLADSAHRWYELVSPPIPAAHPSLRPRVRQHGCRADRRLAVWPGSLEHDKY